ncbi:hypothetical protein ROLI_002780 [Roseobacter fucihabitans]|uniref:HTH cro/C1-type domain-containing protein n=1 Tax=Roseobacter fucihabitans TaxID=1537242 RepID=A0ABZ2BM87_9RHOB|nr:Transposase [Roseobacter litoralis]
MGLKRTDEFRQDAVRIALTSGLTRKQVADDLGVGMSTLNKWITAHRDTDVVSRLRTKYRVQAPELKFTSVRNKPEFLRDLLQFLSDTSSPILIEATDKKFSLCIHLIECLIVPAVGPMDFGPKARLMKNMFADFLADNLPEDVIEMFCKACHACAHPLPGSVLKIHEREGAVPSQPGQLWSTAHD